MDIVLTFICAFLHTATSLLLDNAGVNYATKSEVDELRRSMEALHTSLDKEKKTVAFVAELTKNIDSPPSNLTIIFDNVKPNLGQVYYPIHGTFIAPFPGVYHFSVEITASPQSSDHAHHVRIMKKRTPVAITFVDHDTSQWLRRTASIVLQLDTGDDIWCKTEYVYGSNTIVGGNTYSMFSGFLIHAL